MVKPLTMASPNSANVSDHGCFKYKGVRKRKWGKWVSEIRLPHSRERIWLGSYDSADKAARAFDAALYCLRGDRANFNFPDTPFLFHLPHQHQSLTHHQIQILASSFAKQLHHHQETPPEQPHHEEASAEFHSSPVSVSETGSSTCTSSSSCVQVEVEEHGDDRHSTIDWSFLSSLDSGHLGAIDCGLCFSELDYFEFGESTPELSLIPPAIPFDFNAQEIQYEDAYSHNSFLWNFGYECS